MVVASTLALSAVLGFLRESSIAYKFGATAETDAYLIAMIIPTLFINLIKGSVTNTFITVYSSYMARGEEEEAWRTTNIVLSLLLVVVLAMVLVFTVGTSGVVHLGIATNPLQGLGSFLGRVSLAVAGMSVAVSGYQHLTLGLVHGKGGLALFVFSAIALGVLIYGVLVYLLKIEEVRKGIALILRKGRALWAGRNN